MAKPNQCTRFVFSNALILLSPYSDGTNNRIWEFVLHSICTATPSPRIKPGVGIIHAESFITMRISQSHFFSTRKHCQAEQQYSTEDQGHVMSWENSESKAKAKGIPRNALGNLMDPNMKKFSHKFLFNRQVPSVVFLFSFDPCKSHSGPVIECKKQF